MIKTNALVIREAAQGENNKILTLLTAQNGVITALSKGARKINGKKAGSSQLFAYCLFSIEQRKGRYYIQSAEPIHIFYDLRNSLSRLALASYFMQIIYECVMENQESGSILKLTLNTLFFLETGGRSEEILKSIFELRFLTLAGMMPDVSKCRICHDYMPKDVFFLADRGCICCGKCLEGGRGNRFIFPLDKTLLHTIRHITQVREDKLFSFRIPPESEREIYKISECYVYLRLQRRFSALDFYHSQKK